MPHARSTLTEAGAALVKPGFGSGDFLFSKSEHEKTEAEAVQDWESEGGASAHVDARDYSEITRSAVGAAFFNCKKAAPDCRTFR